MRAATRSYSTSSGAPPGNQALADRIGQHAEGSLVAQRLKHAIRTEAAEPPEAFDRLLELVDVHGLDSAAVAAFVAELAKAARG